MTVSTTSSPEGKKIAACHGIVFGEVISGVDSARDLAAVTVE